MEMDATSVDVLYTSVEVDTASSASQIPVRGDDSAACGYVYLTARGLLNSDRAP